MSRPEIPDTSAFILAMRQLARDPSGIPRLLRPTSLRRIHISSVVAAELYAGTRSPDEKSFIDDITKPARMAGRLRTPTHADWERAGILINRYWRNTGGANVPRDHFADALIVLCAAQVAGTVVTNNVEDMERWADLARRSHSDVTVTQYLL
ncbi:MAG: PIN domain-containing protein [Chloroflexota bacterium]